MITYRYGSTFLQLARTADLSFVMKREPYGIDAVWSTYDIRIKGFLATSEGMFPGVSGTTKITAETLAQVKAELERPRQSMEYRIGGQVIVSVPAGQIDADLGPDPFPCRLVEVNTGTFMVECGCRVAVVECNNPCATADPVVSLRWTQTETFDQNWYSNLTTDGRVVVRSDLLRNADNFRSLATPPLLTDYIRTTSKYTLDPGGTKLDFHYEDQECDRLPPFPATKARGTYVVVSDKPGFLRVGTVNLHLEGQKGTSRKALLVKAVAMAYAKLSRDRFLVDDAKKNPRPVPIIWGRFTEDLFEPVVDISVSAMMSNIAKGGYVRDKGFSVFAAGVAAQLGISPAGTAAAQRAGLAAFNATPGNAVAKINAANAAAKKAAAGVGSVGGTTAGTAGSGTGGGAPAALGSDAAAAVALVMPSVGEPTFGLQSGQPGLAPPDRKRIVGLLTAMFRDPCLCVSTETELRANGLPRTNERNADMVNTAELDTGGGGDFGEPGFQGELRTNAAIINVADLSGDPGSGWLEDDAPYDTYEIETTTTMDAGKLQLPGTGVGTDGGVSQIVTAHGGMMQLVTNWVAGRTGDPPVLPTFQSPDPNVVPLFARIVEKAAVPSPDGASLVFMVAGFYVHAILDPNKYQTQPAVPPMFTEELRTDASDGSGFWSDIATWVSANGKGLTLTTDANPLVPGGVTPGETPTVPAAFDTPQPGFDLSGLNSSQLLGIIQTGQAPSAVGQGSDPNHDFYFPPVRP